MYIKMTKSLRISLIYCAIIIFISFQTGFECTKNDENILNIPDLGLMKGSITQSSWSNQTIFQFLGIPYAEAPSGDLRFKKPVPRSKWDGVLDATQFGRGCPSLFNLPANSTENEDLEDCLTLNVFTKDFSNVCTKRPVMVFFHGGSLLFGSAAEYRSNYLMERDIVYVSIQYRLGALGFASTRTKEIPGNMGLLDVILSLEWIQHNIKNFGGDPNKVTIFGESSGSAIVTLLSVSPKVRKGLFHQIIGQSGTIFEPSLNKIDPVDDSKNICKELNCTGCDEIENINKCLQTATVTQLVNTDPNLTIRFKFTESDFEGIIPTDLVKLTEEAQNHYPIMVGVNKYDAAFVIQFIEPAADSDVTPRQFLDALIKSLGENIDSGIIGNLFAKLVFNSNELGQSRINIEEMMPGFADVASTIVFKSPTERFLSLYLTNSTETCNFLYTFDYNGEYNYVPEVENIRTRYPVYPFLSGPHHADDLLYLFPWYKELNSKDTKMAKKMIDLWTSFAINGKPEVKNHVKIPHIQNSYGPYFHINNKITIDNDFTDEFLVATRESKKRVYN